MSEHTTAEPRNLIPGTSLPFTTIGQPGYEPEGRGTVELTPQHESPSLIEKIQNGEQLDPIEVHRVRALLRANDRLPRQERNHFDQVGGQTDATSGNLVQELYTCPAGWEAHLTNLAATVPANPGAAVAPAINPAAPFGNASSFAFIAVAPPSTVTGSSQALALLGAAVAFAPTSAAGPILPGAWTFNDSNAPIAFGGEAFYYVLVGGAVAAIKSVNIVNSFRLNLYSQVAR